MFIYPRRLSLNITFFLFFLFWVIWTHQLSHSSYYYWPTASDGKTKAEGGRGWPWWWWWWQQWNCKCAFLLVVVKKQENDEAETINLFLVALHWRNKLPGVSPKKKKFFKSNYYNLKELTMPHPYDIWMTRKLHLSRS